MPKAVFVALTLVVMGITGWFVSLAAESANMEAAAANQKARSDYWARPLIPSSNPFFDSFRGPEPVEIPSRARLVQKVGGGVIVLEGVVAVALYFGLYRRPSSTSAT